jgi:hypothetical protein
MKIKPFIQIIGVMLLLLLISSQTMAQGGAGAKSGKKSVVIPLGKERLSIPAPFGFVEASETLPELRKEAEHFVSPGNELIAFFIPNEDYADLVRGQDKPMNKYLFVQVRGNSKSSTITSEAFNQAKNGYRRLSTESFEKARLDVNRLFKERDKNLSLYPQIYSGLTISGMVSLGVLDETPRSITMGTLGSLSRVEGNVEESKIMVGAVAIVLIKGKVIIATMYNAYQSVDDIDWLKELVRDWTRALLGSN